MFLTCKLCVSYVYTYRTKKAALVRRTAFLPLAGSDFLSSSFPSTFVFTELNHQISKSSNYKNSKSPHRQIDIKSTKVAAWTSKITTMPQSIKEPRLKKELWLSRSGNSRPNSTIAIRSHRKVFLPKSLFIVFQFSRQRHERLLTSLNRASKNG